MVAILYLWLVLIHHYYKVFFSTFCFFIIQRTQLIHIGHVAYPHVVMHLARDDNVELDITLDATLKDK